MPRSAAAHPPSQSAFDDDAVGRSHQLGRNDRDRAGTGGAGVIHRDPTAGSLPLTVSFDATPKTRKPRSDARLCAMRIDRHATANAAALCASSMPEEMHGPLNASGLQGILVMPG
ncbi:MAG TPA: hypothetical protein VLB69_03845 [Rudaea sp.]|nr:hypothetical protein [Rudaea sp.]